MLGLPVETTPGRALQEELNRTNGHVVWLEAKVASLTEDDVIFGDLAATRTTRTGDSGRGVEEKTVRAAGVAVWVELLQRERRHLVEVARVMAAAGIASRYVSLAEEQGMQLKRVLDRVLERAELQPADRRRVITLLPGALREIAQEAADDR